MGDCAVQEQPTSARSGGIVNTQQALYFEAVAYFRETVGLIRADQWEMPGLGVWSVRDLVGHTSRALGNVQRDITEPLPYSGDYERAADYFWAAIQTPNIAERVAEQGRASGAALGAAPVAAIAQLHEAISNLLADTPADTRVVTPFGRLPLGAYLDTKIFELMVHTLDISAATGVTVDPPAGPLASALRVSLQLAALRSDIAESAGLLRALTGRAPLPAGYSVI